MCWSVSFTESPSARTVSPDLGTLFRHLGNCSLTLGIISPASAARSPALGIESPGVGLCCPGLGTRALLGGTFSPAQFAWFRDIARGRRDMGTVSPRLGFVSPCLGICSPRAGIHSPGLGKRSPRLGRIFCEVLRSLWHEAACARCSGRRVAGNRAPGFWNRSSGHESAPTLRSFETARRSGSLRIMRIDTNRKGLCGAKIVFVCDGRSQIKGLFLFAFIRVIRGQIRNWG